MTSPTDRAIAKLEAKVHVLQLAIAELKNVADAEAVAVEKVRKTRKKRGVADVMPASAANHRQDAAERL